MIDHFSEPRQRPADCLKQAVRPDGGDDQRGRQARQDANLCTMNGTHYRERGLVRYECGGLRLNARDQHVIDAPYEDDHRHESASRYDYFNSDCPVFHKRIYSVNAVGILRAPRRDTAIVALVHFKLGTFSFYLLRPTRLKSCAARSCPRG